MKDELFENLDDLIEQVLDSIDEGSEDVATYFCGVNVFVSKLTRRAFELQKEKDELK